MFENIGLEKSKVFDTTHYTVKKTICWSTYLDDGQSEPRDFVVVSKNKIKNVLGQRHKRTDAVLKVLDSSQLVTKLSFLFKATHGKFCVPEVYLNGYPIC